MELILPWVSPRDFSRVVSTVGGGPLCTWYQEELGAVVVPDHHTKINSAINAAGSGGVVLVRPGVYKESVRVACACSIFGWGPPGSVVVEAPGWESPLVCVKADRVRVVNVTARCKIEAMCGKCVYVPTGEPSLEYCTVEGTVAVAGSATHPTLFRCTIRNSPGSGLHFSDGCGGSASRCVVENHKGDGIFIERGAHPSVSGNVIRRNGGFAIRAAVGARGLPSNTPAPTTIPSWIGENAFSENTEGTVLLRGGFTDEPEQDDDDEAPMDFDVVFDTVDQDVVEEAGEVGSPDDQGSQLHEQVTVRPATIPRLPCGSIFSSIFSQCSSTHVDTDELKVHGCDTSDRSSVGVGCFSVSVRA